MNRWRCRFCETFNDTESSVCVVCGTEKAVRKKVGWRCRFCETFNDTESSVCIVCNTDKNYIAEVLKKPEVRKPEVIPEDIPLNIRECAFSGCGGVAADGSDFCEYHRNNLCPVCHSRLKSQGMDYCIECAVAIVEKNTSGLRKLDTTFRILDIFASATFVTLLLLYIFYFN